MAEATEIIYTFKELAEILVQQQDIHEAIGWHDDSLAAWCLFDFRRIRF